MGGLAGGDEPADTMITVGEVLEGVGVTLDPCGEAP